MGRILERNIGRDNKHKKRIRLTMSVGNEGDNQTYRRVQ
jgi:hypothetical protein